jgi:hypothetical protein
MPPRMNSESRRKASAKFHAERKAAGWRKATIWLDPESVARVDALKSSVGGADEVHRQAIKAWAGPGATEAEIEAMVGTGIFKTPSDPKIVIDPKPTPRPKRGTTPAAPTGLQFGASKAAPGARLKGGKR